MKHITSESLESLPNIGKTLADKMRKIGVKNAEGFLQSDPFDIFEKVKKDIDPNVCRNAFCAIVAVYKGVRWRSIARELNETFNKRYA